MSLPTTTPQASHNPVLKPLLAGVLLLNLLVAGSIWFSLQNSKSHYEEQAAAGTQNISHVLDQHLSHILKEIDITLLAVSDEAERQLAGGLIQKEALDNFIIRQHSRLPELGALRATDVSGDAIYGPQAKAASTTSLAHRDYFRLLRDDPKLGMVISKPLVGGISGKWMVVFARRINGPDGVFAGLVYAGLGLEYLTRTFKEMSIGPGVSITLLDEDLSLVARYPEPQSFDAEVGRKISSTPLLDQVQACKTSRTFKLISPVDGMERTYSCCRLSSQPFYILTEASTEDYLAGWRAEVYEISLFGAAFCLVTFLSAWVCCRQWKRTRKAEQEVLEGEQRFRALVELSERRRAEEALKENEQRLEQALWGADLGTWDWNIATGEVAFNDRWAEMLGYSREEIEPDVSSWEKLVHPEDMPAVMAVLNAHLAGKTLHYESEHRLLAKSGDWVWVLDKGKVTDRDQQGRALRAAGTHLNITDRKRAEDALRESETNFRVFFESMTDLLLVANPQGQVFFSNTAVTRTLGYSPEELATMSVLDFHPEDNRAEAEAIFAAMLRGERETCPLPLATKTGGVVPVETRVWFGRWNGADCVFGICKNLSAEQEAKQRFERLFRHNPAPLALSGLPERRFTDVNEAFLKTLHYSRDEVIGKTSKELGLFLHPEQQAKVARTLQTAGRISNLELQVRRKDGQILDGLFSGELISSQGRDYLLTVMIDITERRRAEKALRIAHSLAESIIEHAGEGLCVCHDIPDHPFVRFTVWNRRMQEITGYSMEEINRLGWYQTMYPDPLEQERVRERMARMRIGHNLQAEEWEITRSNGYKRMLQITTTLLQSSHSLPHVLALMHDMTEHRQAMEALRKSEEKYRGIFDESVAAIFVFDNKKNFLDCNQAGLDLLGYSREELLHMSLSDVDADPAVVLPAHQQLFSGERLVNYEHKLRRKCGTSITVLNNSMPLTDPNGNVTGMLSTLVDITEIKLAEEALRATVQEIEVLLREVHHRVKNNMQVISSLLTLQAERVKNEQVRQALLDSHQRILAMAMIHEALYDRPNLAGLDLSAYVKSLADHLRVIYSGQADIAIILGVDHIQLSIDQAVPCGLIINELVSNAFKHAFPGGRKGTVQIKIFAVDETEVVLEVCDDGVGLAPELDLRNPPSLGLRLVQGLLKYQLRGSLKVVIDGGTIFTMRWPLPAGRGEKA